MPNKYYYLYGNGAGKQKIFLDDKDLAKFLFLLLHLQSPTPINNTGYYAESFLKTGEFRIGDKKIKEIIKNRHVEVISFAMISDHFQIIIKNLEELVASVYMHRVLTSYGKYFNAKYKKSGKVFDGPFKALLIKNNEGLLQTSAFMHKNIRGFGMEESADYEKYPWSSYKDFIDKNRWGDLLVTNVIDKQFKNRYEYKGFVSKNEAKLPLF